MPPSSTRDGINKVSRHRLRLRSAGLRPVQFWVPDIRRPDLVERLHRQCLSLQGDPAEAEALALTEAAAADIQGWT